MHAGDVLYQPPTHALFEGRRPPELAEALHSMKCPLAITAGNCDSAEDYRALRVPLQRPYLFIAFKGIRILAHHGHLYNRERLIKMAERLRADVCVTGHTHIPVLERQGGVVLINPGSPARPKGKPPRVTAGLITGGSVQLADVETGEILGRESLRKTCSK